jgi:hypothetical protein
MRILNLYILKDHNNSYGLHIISLKNASHQRRMYFQISKKITCKIIFYYYYKVSQMNIISKTRCGKIYVISGGFKSSLLLEIM